MAKKQEHVGVQHVFPRTDKPTFKVVNSQHAMAALKFLDDKRKHPYGPATTYEAVHNGNTYDPKAVAGIAHYLATGFYPPENFSGGEGHANDLVRAWGIEVQPIDKAGSDWTPDECKLIVIDYFDMLKAALSGQSFNKAERNRELRKVIARSRGSVERKHMNISAVLIERALPYIDGYKPNVNAQELLGNTVEQYLNDHPDFFDQPQIAAKLEPVTAPIITIEHAADFFADPPDVDVPPVKKPWKSKRGRKIDYAERDARNRTLGALGEQFTVDLERKRLNEAKRDDLAAKVLWAAKEHGDGCGYDVLSFDHVSEAERWLEVKTTTLGKFHPFLVSRNEIECSEAEPEKFRLYRVFEFTTNRKVFVLQGSLKLRCHLEPEAFKASPPFSTGE